MCSCAYCCLKRDNVCKITYHRCVTYVLYTRIYHYVYVHDASSFTLCELASLSIKSLKVVGVELRTKRNSARNMPNNFMLLSFSFIICLAVCVCACVQGPIQCGDITTLYIGKLVQRTYIMFP